MKEWIKAAALVLGLLVFVGGVSYVVGNDDIDIQASKQAELATATSIEFTTKETQEETTLAPIEVTTTEEETTEAAPEYYPLTYDEMVALCQMVYGEAQTSPAEQKMWVAMVAFNHWDEHCNGGYSFWDIVTDTNQFNGYSSSHPVTSEIWSICTKVCQDYASGKSSGNWVSYYHFSAVGNGIDNYFY